MYSASDKTWTDELHNTNFQFSFAVATMCVDMQFVETYDTKF